MILAIGIVVLAFAVYCGEKWGRHNEWKRLRPELEGMYDVIAGIERTFDEYVELVEERGYEGSE